MKPIRERIKKKRKVARRSSRQLGRVVRQLAPIDCRTFKQVCSLKTDNAETGEYWIMSDSCSVTIAKQRLGHKAEFANSIPKEHFDRLIAWYLKKQQVA